MNREHSGRHPGLNIYALSKGEEKQKQEADSVSEEERENKAKLDIRWLCGEKGFDQTNHKA